MNLEFDLALAKRLVSLCGLVVGANGKGGSGTCVQLQDGSVALLTAKHVVFECLRNTGKVAIKAYGGGFQEPLAIRMDSSQEGDAAFLVFKEFPSEAKSLDFSLWTRNRVDLEVGQRVLACGYPAEIKKIEGRRITPHFMFLGDQITEISPYRIVSRVNETLVGVPKTFAGLSGGGLFSTDGQFIGVVVEEKRRVTETHGELHSLLPSSFGELYAPFSMPADAPTGPYLFEFRSMAMDLCKQDGSGIIATICSAAECMWSISSPDHKHGRIGRLFLLEIEIPGIETHYPINIESIFTWTGDHEDDRQSAVAEEFKFLLMRHGWLIDIDYSFVRVTPMM